MVAGRNTKSNAFILPPTSIGGFEDLLTVSVDVDYVVRMERKNDSDTISNKTFDFSKNTIQQLIKDGYQETSEQMKEVLARLRELSSS